MFLIVNPVLSELIEEKYYRLITKKTGELRGLVTD